MPLNATTYLEQHGWRGKGVPLDGESGRGLKKPLALPMKRNLKGVGKERDRAVEWWDCLFEAGAKKLQSSPSITPPKETISNDNSIVIKPKIGSSSSISLASLAKREHARRLLMSGFVRGRPNEEYEKQVKDLEKTLAEQDQQRLAAKAKLMEQSTLINGQNERETVSLSEKDEEKAKRKEEKKLAKKLLKDSLNRKDKKSKEKKDAKKKRKREEKAAASKSDVQKITDKSSTEKEERAEKRRRKEEKRKQKEDKKQKKITKEKEIKSSSVKADKESKKRKRSSKD